MRPYQTLSSIPVPSSPSLAAGVQPSFEAQLPPMKVHRGELGRGHIDHVNVPGENETHRLLVVEPQLFRRGQLRHACSETIHMPTLPTRRSFSSHVVPRYLAKATILTHVKNGTF